MLKNYLIIAFRNLKRHRGFTFINVTGLALGMTCCILIALYVQDERSFDTFHERADRIFRVVRVADFQEEVRQYANTPAGPGPALVEEYPAVEAGVRIMFPFPRAVGVKRTEPVYTEERVYWADATVFDVFSFPFKSGDPATALVEPNTVVISEAMAEKYFGTEDPIGQPITFNSGGGRDYMITGVIENVPAQSHLQFDMLASLAGEIPRYSFLFEGEGRWSNSLFFTYVLLSDPISSETLTAEMPEFAERHMGEYAESRGFTPLFGLQKLTDIHLRSDLRNESGVGGDIRYIYLFSAVALFILLIACINFMNLATARAGRRAREIGLRKVLGAFRRQLVKQFLGESFLLAGLAVVGAVVLVEALMPYFNGLTGKSLSLGFLDSSGYLLGILGIVVIVGFLAGGYPALYLSRFRPSEVLKGTFHAGKGGKAFRSGLVVFQFCISILMIAGTVIVYAQLEYLQDRPLGFDREQVVVMPLSTSEMRQRTDTIIEQLMQIPAIVHASASAGVPGDLGLIDRFGVTPEGGGADARRSLYIAGVDYTFFDVMGIELIEGRLFSRDFPTDPDEAFVLTEFGAETLGLEDPVGKRITLHEGNGKTGTVIGLVRDFHLQSLHNPLDPVALHIWPERYTVLTARVQTSDMAGTLAAMETVWNQYAPEEAFRYSFLDESFGAQYAADERFGEIFGVFAGLAIIIACLGLFGLVAFVSEQRTKEIGIRKVLGASVAGIMFLLTREYSKLVLLALILAAPLAYFGMNRWLDDFSYHIQINGWILVQTGLIAFSIAWLTVGYQSIKAAVADPVDALRYE